MLQARHVAIDEGIGPAASGETSVWPSVLHRDFVQVSLVHLVIMTWRSLRCQLLKQSQP